MRNKLIIVLAIGLFSFGLTSCKVVRTSPRTIEAYKSKIIIKPLLAEVEVDLTKKITGVSSGKKVSVDDLKEMAKWDACEKSGADIIIDPVYKVTSTFLKTTVEVTGFYGKYVSIETVKEADLEKLEFYTTPSGSSEKQGGSVLTKLKKLKK
ncbi:MAG: hypothetical protein R2780_06490 [Crocinitomicaceae bacterium]|nr:hypothetical protein [Crocinitomicaceae bacterium]